MGHTLGVLRFDVELSDLTEEQRAGLEGAEVEAGGRYLKMAQIDRVTIVRPPMSMGPLWWSMGLALVAGVGVSVAGHPVAGALVPMGIVAVAFTVVIGRRIGESTVSERWSSGGEHGLLLEPDAIVVRRPQAATVIPRAAVVGVDDVRDMDELEPENEHSVAAPTVTVRKLALRFSDGRLMYRLPLGMAIGEPKVLGGADDGITPGEHRRLDRIADALAQWHGRSDRMGA